MSKDKQLLNEAQVRKFMKLYGRPELADGFLKRLNEGEDDTFHIVEDEMAPERFGRELEEAHDELEDPEKDEMEGGMEGEMGGEEEEEGVPPVEEPEAAAPSGGNEAMVKNLVDAIADAIEQASGVEVSVSDSAEGEGMPGEEEALDGGEEFGTPEGEMESPEEEEEPIAEAKSLVGKGEKIKSNDPSGKPMKPAKMPTKLNEAFIKEVSKRVVARLLESVKIKKSVPAKSKKVARKK